MQKGFTPESILILDSAMRYLKSVPYRVSTRWDFYRLHQDGTYPSKLEYKSRFVPITSKARHIGYIDSHGNKWTRDILADETRETIYQGEGNYKNLQAFISVMSENLDVTFDPWYTQSNYVQIWYEARAMTEQFKFYAPHITLQPFGGEPSIPFKNTVMKSLAVAHKKYGNPLTVLYFGDYDQKGLSIAKTANGHIAKWLKEDYGLTYKFIRCGLTPEQVKKYNMPDDGKGKFQWEALSDEQAEEIISDALEPYIDEEAFDDVEKREESAEGILRANLKKLID